MDCFFIQDHGIVQVSMPKSEPACGLIFYGLVSKRFYAKTESVSQAPVV